MPTYVLSSQKSNKRPAGGYEPGIMILEKSWSNIRFHMVWGEFRGSCTKILFEFFYMITVMCNFHICQKSYLS